MYTQPCSSTRSVKVVLMDDFVGDEFKSELHVFIFFYGSHEVEV
jgi:hypothetical protein